MALTDAEVKTFIKTELGDPTVNVELTDAHLQQAIDNALRTFNHWLCECQLRVAYEQEENITIQLESGVRGVAEVKFLYPESERAFERISIFEILYRMVFPRFPISDWYMFRSYYEQFQRVRGTEADWRYDSTSRKLYLDTWSGPYDVFYVVVKDLTSGAFGPDAQKAAYTQKFLDLALARAKLILANIRGKFTQTIPGPGGPVTTDAESLRTDAQKKEEEIVTWLKSVGKFALAVRLG